MRKKPSRTTVYMILVCAFLLAVNVTLAVVLTRQSNAALRSMIENRMLDVSNAAAAMLDGDALDHIRADNKDSPEYRSVLSTLTRFQESIELEYIYCIRDLGDRNFVFLLDPDEDPGQFGEAIACTDALYQASLGTPSVDQEPYRDRWGVFYSAYTPVYNSAREISGIVAVDFSAEWYEQQTATQLRSTAFISVLALFFAAVIIILITARVRARFQSMLDEMNAVSDGIEDLVRAVSPGAELRLVKTGGEDGNDEIARLGGRIRSLEEQLKEQVEHMRAQAFVDVLTGLGNRMAYHEHITRLDEEAKQGTAVFTLAVIDLNGLKEINDRYGHDRGDLAIRQLASALRESFGDWKLYRIGGDEFVAILDAPCPDIPERLARLEQVLGDKEEVSVAKGCAAFDPASDMGFRMVFNRADAAMYNDKKKFYSQHPELRERLR